MAGSNFKKKAIGGGIALVLEFALMDKVVDTQMKAYAQTGAGLAAFFLSKNPIVKTAGLGVGALGAVKAFTKKNVLTQTAIAGTNPFYRIGGINPLYPSGGSAAAAGASEPSFY